MPPEVIFFVLLVVGILFVAFPWVIFHYVTKWKAQASITTEDENLLDGLHELARRLDDRMLTIERIIQAENPNWHSIGGDSADAALEDLSAHPYETSGRSRRPARRN